VVGEIGDERAASAARTLLANRSKGPMLRSAAAVVLGQVGDRSSTATMLATAQDQSERSVVREGAVRGLGYLRDPAASTPLASLLGSESTERLALVIVDALGKIGDPTALAALDTAGQTHGVDVVRQAARETRASRIA
jgi:HEAT repeat protein